MVEIYVTITSSRRKRVLVSSPLTRMFCDAETIETEGRTCCKSRRRWAVISINLYVTPHFQEVVTLESCNKTLRTRHDYLDNSIKRLQEYYLDLIRLVHGYSKSITMFFLQEQQVQMLRWKWKASKALMNKRSIANIWEHVSWQFILFHCWYCFCIDQPFFISCHSVIISIGEFEFM